MHQPDSRSFILNKIKFSLDLPPQYFHHNSTPFRNKEKTKAESGTELINKEISANRETLLKIFVEELNQVGGHSFLAADSQKAISYIADLIHKHGARTIFREADMELGNMIDALFGSRGVEVFTYRGSTSLDKMSSVDVGICSCDFGVAETGTLAVLSKKGRGRLLSLLPPIHIALIKAEQIVPTLEQLFLILADESTYEGQFSSSCLTLITGPSRTGDIEQTLTIGVHGPKVLYTIIIS